MQVVIPRRGGYDLTAEASQRLEARLWASAPLLVVSRMTELVSRWTVAGDHQKPPRPAARLCLEEQLEANWAKSLEWETTSGAGLVMRRCRGQHCPSRDLWEPLR